MNKENTMREDFVKWRPLFVEWLKDHKHSVKFDAYMAGAKRGYELAMKEINGIKNNVADWTELSVREKIAYGVGVEQSSPTPEPGKEYTREQMIGFAEWLPKNNFLSESLPHEKVQYYSKCELEPDEAGELKFKESESFTVDQLLTEYLNHKK